MDLRVSLREKHTFKQSNYGIIQLNLCIVPDILWYTLIYRLSLSSSCSNFLETHRNYPIEYAAVVWNPHNHRDIKLSESLQVEVAGVHLTTLEWFPPMIDCCSQLCLPSLQPSSVTYHTSKHPSLLMITAHLIPLCPLEVITFPQSTINSRRYSFFENIAFLWNTIPLYILEDGNQKIFRHHLYN